MNANAPQMNAEAQRQWLNSLAERVIGSAQRVSSTLGFGFLEKVYENALCLELRKRSVRFEQQLPVHVTYEGIVVGDYVPDILVEGVLIVEIKTSDALQRVHRLQCINYLRATDLRLGLLLNFGRPRLEVGRVVNGF